MQTPISSTAFGLFILLLGVIVAAGIVYGYKKTGRAKWQHIIAVPIIISVGLQFLFSDRDDPDKQFKFKEVKLKGRQKTR